MSAKLIIYLIPLVFASFFFSSLSRAATPPPCEDKDGHCVFNFINCRYGDVSGDCPSLMHCCKDQPSHSYDPKRIYCDLDDPKSGINTAFGCFKTADPKLLISQILTWAVGIASALTLLFIIYGGAMIGTAAGDPKRVKAGQEMITTAVSALIFLALSVVLLNFIGYNILNLSGLGFRL